MPVNYRFVLVYLMLSLIGGLNGQSVSPAVVIDFSLSGGNYAGPISLDISSVGNKLYYTTDGSSPDKLSKEFDKTLRIDQTTVVCALAVSPDGRELAICHTFFIDEPTTTFPIISIGITPEVLFDPDKGLYVKGGNYVDSLNNISDANYWSKKEVEMHCEIFESDGSCVFRSKTGLRLFGGYSRMFPQKSLTIVTRSSYGEKRIDYPLFGKKGPKELKFLVLRNSGSDFGKSHFRDGLMTGLVEEWDLEKQAYRPAHVYINGKYWGIYNMREKINRYFLEAHTDIDKDSFDLLEHYMRVKNGSVRHYRNMLAFLRRYDLSNPIYMDSLAQLMDIDNFLDYQLAQIYFGNEDAGGNIKYWRPQRPDGVWRWILYDTDYGFGLHDEDAQRNNYIEFFTKEDGPRWPNPPWSTFILRKLLENPEFFANFINRLADYLNTSFHQDRVLAKISEMESALLPEIDRHLKRWNLSRATWVEHVQRIKRFAFERPNYLRTHMSNFLGAGDPVSIQLSCGKGGSILINQHIHLRNQRIEGKYFSEVPVKIEALPQLGYRFSHWLVNGEVVYSGKLLLKLKDKKERLVEAIFEPHNHPFADKLVINEICPYNKESGDWLELFNNADEPVNLKGWMLTDLKKNQFIFPSVVIEPHAYLVVSEDSLNFNRAYPRAMPFIGGLSFGLHKRRENLFLYSNDGAAIDSVSYELPIVDTSFSLSLLLPELNNSEQENWILDVGNGTPNRANPQYYLSYVEPQQQQWMRIGAASGLFLLSAIFISGFRRRKKTTYR